MTTINLINNTETFTLNGVVYTHHTETGRFSKTENGKTKRIGITEYQVAEAEADELDRIEIIKAYWMATMAITETREQMDEAWATEEGMQDLMDWYEDEKEAGLTEEDMRKATAETELDAAAENPEISLEQFVELVQEAEDNTETEQIEEVQKELAPKAKKERKPRKSKDIAYTYYTDDAHTNALFTLTAKQVDFLHEMVDTMAWDGFDHPLYVDLLVDEIGGQFAGKPMTVGAMISTLCEKGLGERETTRRDNHKCTSFCLTEMGQAVAIDLGL